MFTTLAHPDRCRRLMKTVGFYDLREKRSLLNKTNSCVTSNDVLSRGGVLSSLVRYGAAAAACKALDGTQVEPRDDFGDLVFNKLPHPPAATPYMVLKLVWRTCGGRVASIA
jgi:hypothetical protein